MPENAQGNATDVSKKVDTFEGLSDRERNALYRLAEIKKLNPGDYLIQEGNTDQTAFVILDGVISIAKVIHGREEEIADLVEGDWVGEIAFTRRIRRTASAKAKVASSVMAINQMTLDALDPQTQVYFYKRLNDLAAARVEDLSNREMELTDRNRQLVNYIHSNRTRGKTDYGESPMIQGIIKKVPRLPGFATNMAGRFLKEDITPSDIITQVKQDMALSKLALKTVNSPLYAYNQKVTDIHQAMMQLGYMEVYSLVMTEGVRRTMPDNPTFREIISHSVAVSHLASALSEASGIGLPLEAATIGLLHDVGQSVIQLLKTKNPNLAMLIDALDSSHLGALLMQEWNMPESICKTVEFQMHPEFSPPPAVPEDIRTRLSILYLAHLIHMTIKGKDVGELPAAFFTDYAKLLGWEGHTVEDVITKRLLPTLSKKKNTYPASFRKLLANYQKKPKAE